MLLDWIQNFVGCLVFISESVTLYVVASFAGFIDEWFIDCSCSCCVDLVGSFVGFNVMIE